MSWKNQLSSQYKNTPYSNIHSARLDRTLPFVYMVECERAFFSVAWYFLFMCQLCFRSVSKERFAFIWPVKVFPLLKRRKVGFFIILFSVVRFLIFLFFCIKDIFCFKLKNVGLLTLHITENGRNKLRSNSVCVHFNLFFRKEWINFFHLWHILRAVRVSRSMGASLITVH